MRIRTRILYMSTLAILSLLTREAFAVWPFNACPPCPPCPPSSYAPAAPGTTGGTAGQPSEQAGGKVTAEGNENVPNISGLGSTQNGYMASNFAAAGAGATSAGASGDEFTGPGNFSTSVHVGTVSNPLILPGLLTAANAESALPQNRIFFNYSYYDQFQTVTNTYLDVLNNPNPGANFVVKTTQQAGFNLNRFDVGFEKTICSGDGSIYGRVPILYADDNVTTADINGVGDLSVGIKYILLQNGCNGDTLTAGLTVAAPTAQPGRLVLSQTSYFPDNGGAALSTAYATVSINPVFLQPWVGGVITRGRWFAQEFFGVIAPLDDRFITSINNNLSVGYNLWTSECEGDTITSIAPILDVQVLAPIGNGGSPTPVSYPTQVFLTEGCQLGLGKRVSVFGGVVEPISNTPAFTIGATGGVNIAF